jgi:hypothetical protein
MKVSIAPMRSFMEVKVPRRIAWQVMIPRKISTMFSHGRAVLACPADRQEQVLLTGLQYELEPLVPETVRPPDSGRWFLEMRWRRVL